LPDGRAHGLHEVVRGRSPWTASARPAAR
jgi:hypothetical protein